MDSGGSWFEQAVGSGGCAPCDFLEHHRFPEEETTPAAGWDTLLWTEFGLGVKRVNRKIWKRVRQKKISSPRGGSFLLCSIYKTGICSRAGSDENDKGYWSPCFTAYPYWQDGVWGMEATCVMRALPLPSAHCQGNVWYRMDDWSAQLQQGGRMLN